MYKLVESVVCVEDKYYNTYGVTGHNVYIEDVTTDRARLERFIKLLNSEEASEVHLFDLIDDFIG